MSKKTVWHDDPQFWETFSPAIFNEQRMAVAAEEVENIIALLQISTGDKILDLCCGPGRHSLQLAKKGFYVTGVDKTVSYLEKARVRANAENLQLELIEEDMRTFCRPIIMTER
jgi:cyclopropane fatty-acyl-phospholipid synthase-like methyltransferase